MASSSYSLKQITAVMYGFDVYIGPYLWDFTMDALQFHPHKYVCTVQILTKKISRNFVDGGVMCIIWE